jgi:DNA repair protein SbcC/Rad50
MNIQLKHLELFNFKGAKALKFDFSDNTQIFGANTTGKTRIVDAWTFLLFGKDSMDRKDFSIKKLDSKNEPLHRVDHVVIGVLSVDGKDTRLERTYREKWVKKRGEEDPEFSGNETVYSINNVAVQQKDYNAWVESILPESLFKQLTNPGYFNSMNWTNRREMLFKIAGDVRDKDVIEYLFASNLDLNGFFELMNGKSFEVFKKELSARIKTLKESKADLPTRIDEVSRAIVPDSDYKQVQVDIDKHNARIFQIDGLISSDAEKYNNANRENQEKQNKIFSIQQAISKLESDSSFNAGKEKRDLEFKKNELKSEIDWYKRNAVTLNNNLNSVTSRINQLVESNNKLRTEWSVLNEKVLTFDPLETICPVCKRAYDAKIIEETQAKLTANFNTDKQTKLQSITNTGKTNKIEIDRLTDELNKVQEQVIDNSDSETKKQTEYDAIIIPEKIEVIPNPQIKVLQDEILAIEGTKTSLIKTDNTDLIQEKARINSALDELKRALNVKSENERHQARKQELIDKEKTLSQQIADLEKQEFQCEKFTRAKVDMIEEKVNQMFSFVRFKMFNRLVNGALEETCDCLINGVPYADANNAARINAGIDIIKTLSNHYNVHAPIFVDNAEAVNDVMQADCQMIKLFVIPQVPEKDPEKSEYITEWSSKGILLM